MIDDNIKQVCILFNAQAIIIDNVKYVKLPLEKWKNETNYNPSEFGKPASLWQATRA